MLLVRRVAGKAHARRLAGEEGSGLIELALAMPVFLLMVFGFVNFALVMYGVCNATYASRLAMRYACLHSSTSYQPATTQDINNVVNPFLVAYPQNSPTTTLTYSGGNTVGGTVLVAIDLTYRLMLPGLTLNAFSVHTQASGVIVQ